MATRVNHQEADIPSHFIDGWRVMVFQRMRPYPRWIVTATAPDGNCYLEHSCGNKYPTKEHISADLLPGAVARYKAEAPKISLTEAVRIARGDLQPPTVPIRFAKAEGK